MGENVPQHSHCQICGKAIPLTEAQCSEECKTKYQMLMKRRKLMVYVMYGLIGIVFAVILFSGRI